MCLSLACGVWPFCIVKVQFPPTSIRSVPSQQLSDRRAAIAWQREAPAKHAPCRRSCRRSGCSSCGPRVSASLRHGHSAQVRGDLTDCEPSQKTTRPYLTRPVDWRLRYSHRLPVGHQALRGSRTASRFGFKFLQRLLSALSELCLNILCRYKVARVRRI